MLVLNVYSNNYHNSNKIIYIYIHVCETLHVQAYVKLQGKSSYYTCMYVLNYMHILRSR